MKYKVLFLCAVTPTAKIFFGGVASSLLEMPAVAAGMENWSGKFVN